jgi:hypothetical protein
MLRQAQQPPAAIHIQAFQAFQTEKNQNLTALR